MRLGCFCANVDLQKTVIQPGNEGWLPPSILPSLPPSLPDRPGAQTASGTTTVHHDLHVAVKMLPDVAEAAVAGRGGGGGRRRVAPTHYYHASPRRLDLLHSLTLSLLTGPSRRLCASPPSAPVWYSRSSTHHLTSTPKATHQTKHTGTKFSQHIISSLKTESHCSNPWIELPLLGVIKDQKHIFFVNMLLYKMDSSSLNSNVMQNLSYDP